MNRGHSTAIATEIHAYAVAAFPPIAISPVVSMGIRIEANVPPIPANRVALDVN